jgi:quinol monooxygenase YgiN
LWRGCGGIPAADDHLVVEWGVTKATLGSVQTDGIGPDLESAARDGVRVRIPPSALRGMPGEMRTQRNRRSPNIFVEPAARHAVRKPLESHVVIVRVLRVTVSPAKVASFDVLLRSQVELMREQPGLKYVKFARRIQSDGSEDAVLFEEWRDAASLYAWVGPNLSEPRLIPGIAPLIGTLEVAHFEVIDSPDGAG